MSLINQMLQDLEKRQPERASPGLSAVRAVPRQRRARFLRPLMLLLALAAGVLAWQLWPTSPPHRPAPLPALAAAAPGAAVPDAAPAAAAPEPQPAPPAEAPLKTPPTSVPPAGAQPLITPNLKESTELTTLPQAAAPMPRAAAAAGAREAAPASIAKHISEPTPQQRAETEYRKALALMPQGRVAEAIDSLGQAVQLDAGHAAARQTLIGLLLEARRFGEAERRLQEGLNLDRAQPELAMTLARLQVERGDAGAAIATLERSQPAAADRADYHGFMAALLQRDGRHAEAIEHYRLALRRTPSAIWQMGLGISLQAENRAPEAREAFSRAKAANSLSPELQAFVEQRLGQLGQ